MYYKAKLVLRMRHTGVLSLPAACFWRHLFNPRCRFPMSNSLYMLYCIGLRTRRARWQRRPRKFHVSLPTPHQKRQWRFRPRAYHLQCSYTEPKDWLRSLTSIGWMLFSRDQPWAPVVDSPTTTVRRSTRLGCGSAHAQILFRLS